MVNFGGNLVRFQKICEFDCFFTFCVQGIMDGSLGKADVMRWFWIVTFWGKLKQGGEMSQICKIPLKFSSPEELFPSPKAPSFAQGIN